MTRKEAVIGDRVIAISHSEGQTVYMFGYGTFEGFFLPPDFDVEKTHAGLQEAYQEAQKVVPDLPPVLTRQQASVMMLLDHANPRILLENGKVVWGYECWWDTVSNFDDQPKPEGFTLVEVDIDQSRAEAEAARKRGPSVDEMAGEDLGDELPESLTPEMIIKAFKDVN
jgi:hypothetical protein